MTIAWAVLDSLGPLIEKCAARIMLRQRQFHKSKLSVFENDYSVNFKDEYVKTLEHRNLLDILKTHRDSLPINETKSMLFSASREILAIHLSL